jgi:uncharacterized integral membrane protein (TIGR00698 family)
MEGLYDRPVVEPKPLERGAPWWRAWVECSPVAAVAAAAYAVHYLPFAPFRVAGEFGVRRPISASIAAIFIGVLLRNALPIPKSMQKAAKSVVTKALPAAIIMTGAGLNLAVVTEAGISALGITVTCMTVAMISAWYFARMLAVHPRTALLLGSGTAICGASAIIAVAPLIEADDDDLTLSMAAVGLIGLVMMFVLPLAGVFIGLDARAFGIWAGTTIHSVPQVVAAGFAHSQQAGTLATLVKLVRVALLAPFVFLLALLYAARKKQSDRMTVHYARLVPPFVWGFFAMSVIATFGFIPALDFARPGLRVPLESVLSETANLLLTMAMAAIGLEVNLRLLAKAGARVLIAGSIAAAILCACSLALIRLFL